MYYISRGLCDHNELLYSCYNKSCDIIGDCKFCVRKALKLKSPVGQQQLYMCIIINKAVIQQFVHSPTKEKDDNNLQAC